MTPARWRDVTRVYAAVVAREPAARAEALTAACGNDEELRREVEALLAEDAGPTVLDRSLGEAAAAVGLADLTGRMLGPYRIEAAVGAGGMGQVYRATDTRLQRTVAIKILPAELSADPQFRGRFDREAKAIAALNHPHICTLHDIGSSDGIDYLVMEHIEGETLSGRLDRGALPFDQALTTAIEIADALAAAHHRGIVHRDLKPGNVMLSKTGVKLLDFGLAKPTQHPTTASTLSMLPTTPPVGPTRGAPLTAQGTILGTLQYMAPEQLEGHEADARSDIFAFGTVLYEMVTGTKPFNGRTPASLIAAILEREPASLSTIQPLVPRDLDRLVSRCLSKEPDQRWQSAADVSVHLRWIAEAGAASQREESPARRHITRWRWVSAALLVLLAAVVALFASLWRSTPAVPEPVVFSIATPEGTTLVTPVGPPGGLPWLALSPDGRVLAFVALSADGRQQLWMRPLAQASAHPVAGTDGAQAPFWSPDSRYVAFFAQRKLKYVDAAGGSVQIVTDAPGLYGSGSWNIDNTIVFSPTPRGEGLWKVKVGTPGDRQLVTHVDTRQEQRPVHFSPQFLPDGRHFLFGVGGVGVDAETWIGSIDGDQPRLLLRADAVARYAAPGYLLFKRGPLVAQRVDADLRFVGDPIRLIDAPIGSNPLMTYLALSTSMTGTLAYGAGPLSNDATRVVWKNRSGQTIGAVDMTNASAAPSLSRDGSMMAISRNVPQTGSDLWLYDVKRTTMLRFTFDAALERSAVWSPDGTFVVFTASRDGVPDRLYRKSTTGSGPEELISSMAGAFPTDWSSDGAVILVQSSTLDQRNGWDLWTVSLAERQPKPLVRTPFNEVQAALSPDRRWLAYASDESGAFEIYVQPFRENGPKRIVSTGGGAEPRWRGDGRELFYVSADRHLMAVPTTIGPGFEAGKPQALFEMSVRDLMFPFLKRYDVTHDGQRFLVQELTGRGGRSALTVVINWPALLSAQR